MKISRHNLLLFVLVFFGKAVCFALETLSLGLVDDALHARVLAVALSVVHIGSGPAVWVGNNGTGDIASFYDIDQNIEVLHVGGVNSTNPNVGVHTSTPNERFTVSGNISASNIIYANGSKLASENFAVAMAIALG